MLSLNLPTFALPRFFAARFFMADAQGSAPVLPMAATENGAQGPELVSPYDTPPADLDQRVRAVGEW